MMFCGIDVDYCTEDELQNFKEYYKKYRDEILSNIEIQEKLPGIFWKVKDGMQIDRTPRVLAMELEAAGGKSFHIILNMVIVN